jgi:hypothetical protein
MSHWIVILVTGDKIQGFENAGSFRRSLHLVSELFSISIPCSGNAPKLPPASLSIVHTSIISQTLT